jgi:hypothetical protein
MAYVHQIKFFNNDGDLHAALFDNPHFFCDEFWIKNVEATELGIKALPDNVELEKKYNVADLGIKPFHTSKPEFEFMDKVAEAAWKSGIQRFSVL